MTLRARRLALNLGLLAAFAFAAFAFAGITETEPGLQARKTGVVLDEAGKPLAGVYVGVRWMAQTTELPLLGGKVEGQCLYRTVVRTDADGHYSVPPPADLASTDRNWLRGASTRYFWDLYTYGAGYATTNPSARPAIASNADNLTTLAPIYLASDSPAGDRHLTQLADTLARFTCRPYAKDAGPVEEQIVAESAAAACLTGNKSAQASCAMERQASSLKGSDPINH
jgi:hypothetical protein